MVRSDNGQNFRSLLSTAMIDASISRFASEIAARRLRPLRRMRSPEMSFWAARWSMSAWYWNAPNFCTKGYESSGWGIKVLFSRGLC